MAVVDSPLSGLQPGAVMPEVVMAAAAEAGFELAQFETADGITIWEWRRGSEPRPQFVTRRVALVWMQELLSRERAGRAS
jgi:hypothetical protein